MSVPRIALWAVAWAAVASPHAALGQLLRLSPDAGAELHLVFHQVTNQATEVQGKSVEMEYTMGMEVQWKIESVDEEGTIAITQRFTRFRVSIESPDVDPIAFDTASEERPIGYAADLAETVASLLDHDIRLELTALGDIQRVVIPDETMDALRQSPGSMPIRQLFTPDGMTDTLRGSMAVLPEREVAAGDTWTSERVMQLTGGSLTQTQHYTYEGLADHNDRPMHRISVTAELAFTQPEDDLQEPQVITDQEVSGTIWLDPETGMFLEADIRSTLITETEYRDDTLVTIGDTVFTMIAQVK